MGPALEYVDRAVAWAEENSEKIGHVPRATCLSVLFQKEDGAVCSHRNHYKSYPL